MKALLAAMMVLSAPIFETNHSDNEIVTVHIDNVHPGASSIFRYSFTNTTEGYVDVYFVSIVAREANALAHHTTLSIDGDVLNTDGHVYHEFLERVPANTDYSIIYSIDISSEAGNEIQGQEVVYELTFGLIYQADALPSSGQAIRNWWGVVLAGLGLILCGILRKDDNDDETTDF